MLVDREIIIYSAHVAEDSCECFSLILCIGVLVSSIIDSRDVCGAFSSIELSTSYPLTFMTGISRTVDPGLLVGICQAMRLQIVMEYSSTVVDGPQCLMDAQSSIAVPFNMVI
eukprot:g33314.t1